MKESVYPFHNHNEMHKTASNIYNGNFGLWYNKFTPINNFFSCKASDEKCNEDNVVPFYNNKYNKIQKEIINNLLLKRHQDQKDFCETFNSGYEAIVIKARLKTPLITGIGEIHPHEVSMVLDYNMGIPYIPASGIKGIVRFAHTLSLIDKIPEGKLIEQDKHGKPCPPHFDVEEEWTDISRLFGTQKNRGLVIFLDSYPENVPDLHVDIMNPHYGKYYDGQSPPADYLDPNPIKFLTVAKDTVFIFRALVDKKEPDLINRVKDAFIKALAVEGVGAKTAVGYGLFQLTENEVVKTEGINVPGSPTFKTPEPVIWEKVRITYAANKGEINASYENKNAFTNDKTILSEELFARIKKGKPVVANVKVELIGGRNYRLQEIVP